MYCFLTKESAKRNKTFKDFIHMCILSQLQYETVSYVSFGKIKKKQKIENTVDLVNNPKQITDLFFKSTVELVNNTKQTTYS